MHDHVEDHPSPSTLWWAEGVHLPLPWTEGNVTVSETTGHWHRCRGHRGSREKKQLAPVRLDMPIFKLTDPGVEVMYTLWHFDVDAFLEQYDEASMHPPHFCQSQWVPRQMGLHAG